MLVEILYFDGCPNHQGARELVEKVSDRRGIAPEIRIWPSLGDGLKAVPCGPYGTRMMPATMTRRARR